ncbi:YdhK family protein [Peribacillus sp. SCS-155]|uniref:YdhK family protein n=1 Tax=Peribacillus sedimenti TaxID=3115297 RepID=UPI003905F883
MKHRFTFLLLFLTIIGMTVLSACGDNHSKHNSSNPNKAENSEDHSQMDHSMHSSSGKLPVGLKSAENPAYKVGSEVIVHADHMEGMNGAAAKVTGAFQTTAYVVSYTPTTGGKKVTNHKWVIEEEIQDAGDKKLEPGTEVTLEADHMEGMKGATATIDSAEQTTVYMVDITPTNGGEIMKNHKWVTEDELSAK